MKDNLILAKDINNELKELYVGLKNNEENRSKLVYKNEIYKIQDNSVLVLTNPEGLGVYIAHWAIDNGKKSVVDLESCNVFFNGNMLTKTDMKNYNVCEANLVFVPYRFDLYNESDERVITKIKNFLKSKIGLEELCMFKSIVYNDNILICIKDMLYIIKSKGKGEIIRIKSAEIKGYTTDYKTIVPVISVTLKEFKCLFVLHENEFKLKKFEVGEEES